MYKVFFNERFIVLAKDKKTSDQGGKVKIKMNMGDLCKLPELIENFLNGNEQAIQICYRNEPELWEKFRKQFLEVPAAGGVVRRGEELLFIFRNGKWDLPKGKIDPGESPREAAIREVKEECGISSLDIIRELPSTYHIYQSPFTDSPTKWILKETSWFEMEYSGFEVPRSKEDEGITSVKWMNASHMLPLVWASLRPVISLYC